MMILIITISSNIRSYLLYVYFLQINWLLCVFVK